VNYTKGEWRIHNLDDFNGYDIETKSGISIGSIIGKREQDLANAHLIAASPDLYEALKALVEYQSNYGGVAPNLANAIKALAKAEGN